MRPERIAIIDLGSNSARLIVMHIDDNGAYNLAYHQKEAVRLSEGMAGDGLLQPAAMRRAIHTLAIFARMIELLQVDITLAVATAAVRNARNGPAFIQQVEQETGINVQIICGDAEATLGYLGVTNTIDIQDAVLFDLGGGSTELTLIKNRKAEQTVSLPFGSVNLTEKFNLQNNAADSQLESAIAFMLRHFEQLPWLKDNSIPLIGTGGTARNIAKIDQKRKNYPIAKVHNYRLGWLSFAALWQEISRKTLSQRRKTPGLSNGRADIILGGLSIVKGLFDITRSSQLIISGCGVREGVFFQHYLGSSGGILPDILEHSANNMLLFYKGHTGHASHVADLAAAMFNGWSDLLALSARQQKLLRVAALLHDIGITINYYDHPRHSAYLVENARLFGLTHREQLLTAVIAGWHERPSAKFVNHRVYHEFLDENDWQTARKLALLLAIAETLDASQIGLVKKIEAVFSGGQAHLLLFADEPIPMAQQTWTKLERWFKKDTGANLTMSYSR
ncbi:exopolyphosphatase / guanosine-5'-triphosphate,3'-diphosphate pyrophosphatase [Dendrosporobacter quercicolus]|uniref:Chaperone protein DnaK n=1 Tax=Dendrosporobacter quercicolus TaxID=146817 RepID=A0A1G9Z2F3_9FIRM|nr:Ppx/GppA phosphatase family protein [Dendrosporobacter quercicolus]SDN15510.1 exopolyphosphatase / guanosine-5'-triphosphate,3'-diphosphate pyrophosphatase [Dendrosporobacter quercicolus]